MDANKKICLDEVSVRLLRSLKSERQKLGISQRELAQLTGINQCSIGEYERGAKIPPLCRLIKLSETFGYDLSTSVNYKYWYGKIDWWKLRQQLTYYGFTCRELSSYVGYRESAVNKVFWQIRGFSLDCLNAILGVFEDERRLLKFRKELLSRKTLPAENGGSERKPQQCRTARAVIYGSGHSERRQEESCGRCERVSGKC